MSTDMGTGSGVASEITVVTGLPRSGTSMMMQMLVAGGLPALTDGLRKADEDNLKGYFEFEGVKNLRQDKSWLPRAKGHAVKVIAQLLEYFPLEQCRCIFMQRDLNEVLRSQRAMLQRSEKLGGRLAEERLKDVFAKQLLRVEKMLESRQAPLLKIDFRHCIDNPASTAKVVSRFLGIQLDEQAMAAVVDAKLYRQRN